MRLSALILATTAMNCLATDVVQSDFGTTYFTPFASLTGVISTGNDFPDTDSKDGDVVPFFGVMASQKFSENFEVRGYFNTDTPLDFLFLDSSAEVYDETRVGLRLGRITIPAGMFTGYARALDGVNFLPQSTDPDRIGRAFYRYDGASVYSNINISTDTFMTVEFLYGESNIDEPRNLLAWTTYSWYDYDTSTVENTDPVAAFTTNVYHKDWQFLFNLTYSTLDMDLYFKEFPAVVSTRKAPTYSLRAGAAYAYEKFDFVFTYFETLYHVEEKHMPVVIPLAVGDFQTYGVSLHISYLHDYHWSWYGGLEFYKEEKTDIYRPFVVSYVPRSIEDSHGIYFGNVFSIDHAFFFITEARVYDGTAVLVPDNRPAADLKDVWGVFSWSVVYKF